MDSWEGTAYNCPIHSSMDFINMCVSSGMQYSSRPEGMSDPYILVYVIPAWQGTVSVSWPLIIYSKYPGKQPIICSWFDYIKFSYIS